jgi:hypothetical protein
LIQRSPRYVYMTRSQTVDPVRWGELRAAKMTKANRSRSQLLPVRL